MFEMIVNFLIGYLFIGLIWVGLIGVTFVISKAIKNLAPLRILGGVSILFGIIYSIGLIGWFITSIIEAFRDDGIGSAASFFFIGGIMAYIASYLIMVLITLPNIVIDKIEEKEKSQPSQGL